MVEKKLLQSIEKKSEAEMERSGISPSNNSCQISPSINASVFCEGIERSIEIGTNFTGLNKRNFQYQCRQEKVSTQVPKDFENIQDPNILNLFQNVQISVDRLDPSTNSLIEGNGFLTEKEDGEFQDSHCKMPKKIYEKKFCAGFREGGNIFFDQAQVDKSKNKVDCKLIKNKELNEDELVYGYARYKD